MPEIRANGARLYYEEHGGGPETIVFAHSMLFNCRMFDAQVASLKDRYRCLLYDFRGQGQSEVTEDGYDLDTLADDAAAVIEALGDPPVHFLGFSMGGMVGLRLAIRRPELLRSLMLVDTSADAEGAENKIKAQLLTFLARRIGPRFVTGQVMPLFFSKHFLKDPARQGKVREWRGHFEANDRIGVSRAVRGVIEREAVIGQLDKIRMPTLIVMGEEDAATSPEKSRRMQAAIAGSLLVTIPRAGHMTPVEEPEAVNAALESFLAGLAR
ncbi:MAG: alpha/beta fold hydrolase [Candidatus Promineifilaceae bacterium]